MKIALPAAIAAALALSSAGALAHASATADIGGISVTQDGSGANFGITFWQVSLGSFESTSRVFDYSVTLHTDALPATRTWDDSTLFACLPLHEMKCGPDATGMELVEAYLETYRDGREANPFITFSGIFADDLFYSAAGTETVSGSFTLTATNTGIGPQSDSINLFASLWVDSSDATPAVPEPGSLALGLAGLSAVLAGLRRGRRPA
jgi:hypothetical protein